MLIFSSPACQKAYLDVIHREAELARTPSKDHRYLKDTVDRVLSWPLTSYTVTDALMGRVVMVAYISPNEFAWREYAVPDEAMYYGIDLRHPCVVPGMNGGFINHGTEDAPDWGSHT